LNYLYLTTELYSLSQQYTSIANILDRIPYLHPELEFSVSSIIADLVDRLEVDGKTSAKDAPIVDNLKTVEGMTFEKLSSLLKYYGAPQLIVDREQWKKIHLAPQRLLSNLSYVRSAHILVNIAKCDGDDQATQYTKLAKVLEANPKASLPHPQWNPIHDAILVTAISKHGWIDRESHCRAMIDDDEIKWGVPFEKPTVSKNIDVLDVEQRPAKEPVNPVQRNTQTLRLVADRVAKCLNEEHEAFKACKGFNLNLVQNSYSIVTSNEEGATKWVVDYEDLENSTKDTNADGITEDFQQDDDFSEVELPTRKDLLRRARLLLLKPLSTPDTGENTQVSSHKFSVLDQSEVCNIFLAELLREAIKVGQKQQKWISKLLSNAQAEAEMRSSEYPEDSKDAKELQKIANHVLLVKQNSKPFIRPAKNVLRAVLGMEVHRSTKPNEGTFVVERKALSMAAAVSKTNPISSLPSKTGAIKTSPAKKNSRKARGVESTAGDAAINKALSIGKYPERNIPIPHENFLRLTSIETLLLSVMCSQGMPVCDEDWQVAINSDFENDESYALSWFQTGSVLEAAAETWYSMTDNRVQQAQLGGEEMPRQLLLELQSRQMVYAEASNLRQNPTDLAKKAIMLVEALRLHSGNKLKGSNKKDTRLGSRTLQWSSNHIVKWGQVIGVFFSGRVIPNCVIANRPEITPTALVDEKGCAAIYSQVVQQTRLRALYLKYEGDVFSKMLSKAGKKCDTNDTDWEDRPSWWCGESDSSTSDDENLICGILQYGYGGFDEMARLDDRFSESSLEVEGDIRFDRLSAQVRLDCLTRELSAIDDTAESLRLIKSRKENPQMGRVNAGVVQSTQVGIDVFFMPKGDVSGGDDSSVEIIDSIPPPGGKRKTDSTEMSPEKKTKK